MNKEWVSIWFNPVINDDKQSNSKISISVQLLNRVYWRRGLIECERLEMTGSNSFLFKIHSKLNVPWGKWNKHSLSMWSSILWKSLFCLSHVPGTNFEKQVPPMEEGENEAFLRTSGRLLYSQWKKHI